MLAYTAVDGLRLVSRSLGPEPAVAPRDALSLAPHSHRPMSAAAVQALQQRVGHGCACDARDSLALLGSGPAIGAWVGEQLVGFARALSDGRTAAVIDLVLVDPGYRHQGVGAALRARLSTELAGIPIITRM